MTLLWTISLHYNFYYSPTAIWVLRCKYWTTKFGSVFYPTGVHNRMSWLWPRLTTWPGKLGKAYGLDILVPKSIWPHLSQARFRKGTLRMDDSPVMHPICSSKQKFLENILLSHSAMPTHVRVIWEEAEQTESLYLVHTPTLSLFAPNSHIIHGAASLTGMPISLHECDHLHVGKLSKVMLFIF